MRLEVDVGKMFKRLYKISGEKFLKSYCININYE